MKNKYGNHLNFKLDNKIYCVFLVWNVSSSFTPDLSAQFFETDAEIACIGQPSKDKIIRRAAIMFRQPFYRLGRKGDINGICGLCHYYRHEPLPVWCGDVTPTQFPYVTDTKSAKTGKQVCSPYLLVKEWRGYHFLYLLDGQKIPFAFGNFDFLGHLQFVPRIWFNQSLTHSLVQSGTQKWYNRNEPSWE